MLRARLPLAVVLAATALLVPATAAIAATPDDPTGVTQEVTEQSQSSESDGSEAGTQRGAAAESDSGTPPQDFSTQAEPPANPLEGTPLEGIGDTLTDPTIIPESLEGLGTCLEEAGPDPTAGQLCFEDFLGAIGVPNSDCFSENDFTLEAAIAKLQEGLSGSPSQEEFQQNLEDLAAQFEGLIECLTATPAPSSSPSSAPPVSSGGGGAAPVTEEAPAAVAVTGTPTFTG